VLGYDLSQAWTCRTCHHLIAVGPNLQVYVPYEQWPWVDDMNIVVRTAGDPSALAGSVQAAVREIDPAQPISQIATFREWIDASVGARRFTLFLIAGFAALALLLAAVGVYGVTTYSVSQRVREIGIRMALGASPGAMRRMVLRNALGMAIAGAVFGLVASLALSRLLTSMLFGIHPGDPLTFLSVTAPLMGVVVAACWLPARRATQVDPQIVLRQD